VLGPYRDGIGYRIIIAESPNQKRGLYFETKQQAARAKRIAEQESTEIANVTVKEAIDTFELYQRDEKHDKPQSVRDTCYRLRLVFTDEAEPLANLTPARCQALVGDFKTRNSRRGKPFAVDSLKNILAESNTFANWCVRKKWLKRNPLVGIKIEGKRKHGKLQLRIDEARRWMAKALELAQAGEAGAVAALVALIMGFRSSEIVRRSVRDLDDDGSVLVVEHAKTPAGNRRVQVPDFLQPLLKQLAVGKSPDDRLFGRHWRDWVRKWVRKICREVGVPEVGAHSMRGLHSILAVEAGMSANVVAASMGHESSTTLQSYAKPDGVAEGRTRKVTAGLMGNSPKSGNRRNIVPVSFRKRKNATLRRRFP
jgi:integrase